MSDDDRWFDDNGDVRWNWPRAVASVAMTVGFVVLVAMCAGWMPWQ